LLKFLPLLLRFLLKLSERRSAASQQMPAGALIDNAVRHNIRGGAVQVSTGTISGLAVLSVTNSGQVIPPAEVDRLFQPFQRLGPRPARRDGGHGLGLSIVRAIASAHAATITAKPKPGGGLSIEVTFLSSPVLPRPRR
jgi:signal transduction histidine kinase